VRAMDKTGVGVGRGWGPVGGGATISPRLLSSCSRSTTITKILEWATINKGVIYRGAT
jgi:hypothetical protein